MRPRVITRGNSGRHQILQGDVAASMRPRVITRGNRRIEDVLDQPLHASMRPRVITRGNGLLAGSTTITSGLQ